MATPNNPYQTAVFAARKLASLYHPMAAWEVAKELSATFRAAYDASGDPAFEAKAATYDRAARHFSGEERLAL